jgi:hypothetical protein
MGGWMIVERDQRHQRFPVPGLAGRWVYAYAASPRFQMLIFVLPVLDFYLPKWAMIGLVNLR